MKKVRTIGISLLIVVCAVCLSLAFVACKGGDKNANYGAGEEGFYYYDGADSARYMLSLQSGTYMITSNNETQYSGSYSYDEETGVVSFTGDASFSASIGENALSLAMGDSGYSFKAYKYFDVTYVDDNWKVVATESVLNGQSAKALDIEKEGYWFVGWFEDENNSVEFAFDTSIAGDTTVYGWYIEKNHMATEYEITLDYGDGTTEVVSTMNGAVWTLPSLGNEGDILGWWVSATNKSGELTYKYTTGTSLSSDTTLFAVYSGLGASVTAGGVTWENVVGANVSVTVYNEYGIVAISQSSASSSSSSYAPSGFSSLSAGIYTVEVTSGNTTEYLTYVVNGLSRVSKSSMEIVTNGDGRVLSFAPVENAFGYTITIDDGEKVVTEDLGSRTYYNLSGWEMTEAGLTITITAYADGYVSSVSEEYGYLLKLDSVVIEMSEDDFSWNRVDGALEYEVIIYAEDGVTVLESFYTTDTSYSLKYYDAGIYTISVKPVTDGYWSTETFIHGQSKSTIAAPVITDITSYTISWTEIGEAESYVVMVNGTEYAVSDGTTLAFSKYNVPTDATSYEIAVMAIAKEGLDSSYSDTVTATNGGFESSVRYEKNTVYWDYDVSATSYVISVNGNETTVTEGNSGEIVLTQAGNNEIIVTAYSDGAVLGQAEIDVYAYSVILDPNGANLEGASTLYVAQGDVLNLGEVTKEHAAFISWYTQADYTDGQSDVYEGKGSEVADGSVFTGSRDMYLYAYWTYEYIDVTLYVGEDVYAVTRIKYNSKTFTLPMVDDENPENLFVGWFTQADGAGVRYSSYNGESSGTAFGEYTALYAYYLPALSYQKTTYEGQNVYAVSANTAVNMSLFPEIRIPESYIDENGEEYALILDLDAFANCLRLERIEIPDTILYIAVTNDGYSKNTGAFAGCTALREVEIYATGDGPDSSKEVTYFSEDGVLFHKISGSGSGEVELLYYPYAKTISADARKGISDGEYVIPSTVSNVYEVTASGQEIVHTVTTIPALVFSDRNITKIVMPDTVTLIDSNVFSGMTGLTSITLGAGVDTIADQAFSGCTSLGEIKVASGNGNYTAVDGILYRLENGVATELLYCPINNYVKEIVVASNVTSVADGAFDSNASVMSVTFAATGEFNMGKSVFSNATALTTVVLPAGLTSIPDKLFYKCTYLTDVTIPEGVTSIGTSAFEVCSYLTGDLTDKTGGITLPVGLTTIGDRAFFNCQNLAVTIPASVTYIGSYAFYQCWYTAETESAIVFGSSSAGDGEAADTLTIGSYAFQNARYATAVEIPAGVTELQGGTFWGLGTQISSGTTFTFEKGSKLTSIGNSEFNGANITQIVLPATVTSIGNSAFSGTKLTSVKFAPDGETSQLQILGSMVFYNVTTLTEVTIPASVTSIGSSAFEGTGLTKITIEGGDVPLALADAAFKNTKVTELEIPARVNSLVSNVFASNSVLTKVTFVSDAAMTSPLTATGTNAFQSCVKLETVTLPSTLVTISEGTFSGCTALVSVTIPASVTTIGKEAFKSCEVLATITFGTDDTAGASSLSSIGDSAFAGCASLADFSFPSTSAESISLGSRIFDGAAITSITLTEKIKDIGTAFQGLSLSSISVDSGNTAYTVDSTGKVLYGVDGSIAFVAENLTGEYTIPEGVTAIGDSAFYGQTGLTSVTIASTVTSIGSYAFAECTSLTTVKFTDISSSELENESLSEYGHQFENCTSLKDVELPAAVTTLPTYCFYGCDLTGDISALANIKVIGERCFQKATVSTYTFTNVTTIGTYAFSESGLESAVFSTALTSIGTYAFNGCTKLQTVTLAEGIGKIDNNTFYGCTALGSITLPESCTTLGNNVFYGCSALESVTMTDSVTSIGTSLFRDCTSLKEVTLSSNIATLGNQVFYNCSSLASIELPESLGQINSSVFYGCSSLTSIEFGNSLTQIGANAFQNCTALKTVKVGSGVTSLGNYAFSGCTSLTYAYTGDLVTATGNFAFQNCTSLVTVEFGGRLVTIGANTFNGCTSLVNVIIPASVSTVSASAFSNCSCDIYIVNTMDYAATYWTGWDTGFKGTSYYYSQTEPLLNEDGTAYDGDYWYYDEYGGMAVWTYTA